MNGQRHVMQIRPRNGDGPAYSPQRDLAWIYAPAMREALQALDQVRWTDEMAALIQKLGITEEDISVAVATLVDAHRYIVNHADVATPVQALETAGWYRSKPEARYLIYGRLGEVLFGGFFLALRDTSEFCKESSQAKEIAEFIAAGRLVMIRGSGATAPLTPVAEAEQALETLKAMLNSSRDALLAAHARMQEVERKAANDLAALQRELTNIRERENLAVQQRAAVEHMGFFRTLWYACARPSKRLKWLAKICGAATSLPS